LGELLNKLKCAINIAFPSCECDEGHSWYLDGVLDAFFKRDDIMDLWLPNSKLENVVLAGDWAPGMSPYSFCGGSMYVTSLKDSKNDKRYALHVEFYGTRVIRLRVAEVRKGITPKGVSIATLDWRDLLAFSRPRNSDLRRLWRLRRRAMKKEHDELMARGLAELKKITEGLR
jgi:hypothetical protein